MTRPSDNARRGRRWLAAGALGGLLAVAFGAFASHALGDLPAERGEWLQTALRYHMLHSAALLAVGIVAGRAPGRLLDAAGASFVGGLLVFSGLLYAMAVGGPRWLGALVPLGGLAYMLGWGLLLAFALKDGRAARPGDAPTDQGRSE